MVHNVSNATQTQPVAPPTGTSAQKSTQKSTQSKPAPVAGNDSVQLSQAAQAALAALQEARETPAQTSKEAGNGDLQARKLLATEAAAKSAKE